jgi:GT2 family glycosyltransferase
MTFKPIGLLVDTYYDNTGDKAIRLAMEDFLREASIPYEVLDPNSFDPSLYSHIIVGGGHLIRDPDGGYYDAFRVPGPHILNTVGLTASRELEYLREYELVSVRSTADRDRLLAAIPELDVSIVPCTSIALRSEEVDFTPDQPTIGLQISPAAFEVSRGIETLLSEVNEHNTLFIPFMHYSGDRETMEPLASAVPGAQIAPYLQPRQVFSLIGQLRAFVSCSLHGSIFAYANKVPFLAFDSEGTVKIREFMTDRGLEKWLFRDIDDLREKLPQLLSQPPDYSELLTRDTDLIEEHFQRMASILREGLPESPGPDAEADVTSSIQRIRSGVAERDMELARLRNVYSIAVRKLTHEVTRRDHHIAHQQDAIAEQQSTITDRDSTIAQQAEHIAAAEAATREADLRAAALARELEGIRSTFGYRAVEKMRRGIDAVAPPGTKRRVPFMAAGRAGRIVVNEGIGSLIGKAVRVGRWAPTFRQGPQLPDANLVVEDQYQEWLRKNSPTPAAIREMKRKLVTLEYQPLISIVMPTYNTDPDWLREAVDSVRQQIYENWELCIADDGSTNEETKDALRALEGDPKIKIIHLEANGGISAASNAALAAAEGEFIGLLDHDDELRVDALYWVVRKLNEEGNLDFIYTDEDKKDLDGRRTEPFFKPDWSPDLEMSVNYVTHFSVFRREIIERAGGFRSGYDGSQDYDLVLRVMELTDRIAHIAKPLYTWRRVPGSTAAEADAKHFALGAAKLALQDALKRRGYDGEVTDGMVRARYRVRYAIKDNPKVTIVIPTRDRVDMLRRAVTSVRQKSTYDNYEILIVDNDSQEQETLDYFETCDARVFPFPGEFHYSRMNNTAVREAAGADYILFLNNDTMVITPDWIESMLEHAQRPEVAAVGARLLYPDGRVQHEGVIMGIAGGSAGNVDHGGYFGLGETIRNCSAVTAACMMTRNEAFWDLGGFDEKLRVAFNDVDFCLRAREKGYQIVYTPYAQLYHFESASRGSLHPMDDEQFFRDRWGNPGEYKDPYYNANLDILRPFSLRV